MDWTTYAIPLFFLTEILVLLGLYYFVLRHWIADHLEDRFREDNGSWLVDILSPAIQDICNTILDSAPALVVDTLKHELLSNQGVLSRVSKADPHNEEEVGLEMAEMALQSLGIKKPGAIMTIRMGKTLLDMYNKKQGSNQGNNQANSLITGADLFKH